MNLPTKTFQKNGKWVAKPLNSVALLCPCGNKYVKTRKDQKVCIRCIYKDVRPQA